MSKYSVLPAFAALFAPPKLDANGNMLPSQEVSETTTPAAAAAFVSAVQYIQSAFSEPNTIPLLLRNRASELYALADLVEAAEEAMKEKPLEAAEDKPKTEEATTEEK